MKKLLNAVAVLLSASLFCIPVPVRAENAAANRCGDRMTWRISEDGTLTISGSGEMWNYDPYSSWEPEPDPSAVDGYPPWILYSDTVRALCVEEGVRYIGSYAFYEMYCLEDVTLPSTLRTVMPYAFSECPCLQAINFPDGLECISDHAFAYTSLTEVSLPDSVKSLGCGVFEGNTELTSVTLREGLLEIGDSCFGNCSALSDITFPESVIRFGTDLMNNDTAWYRLHDAEPFVMLNSRTLYRYFGDSPDVEIPDGVTQIDAACFTLPIIYDDGGAWIWETVRDDIRSVALPDSLTELPERLFSESRGLEQIRFGSGIRTVPEALCQNCTALTQVILPNGLLSIEKQAFSGCTRLETIRIPGSVQDIDPTAFQSTAFWENTDGFLICGSGFLLRYRGDINILTVPDGVKVICADAFRYADVVSLTLPETVRTLKPGCFASGTLTELLLNDGLTEIPENAFRSAAGLSCVRIPESVTKISPSCCAADASFTVVGKAGSAAERFAAAQQLPFSETMPAAEGPDMTLDPETDCWSFRNTASAFSTQNYLSGADRALLEQNGLEAETTWSGSCFGMCAAILLAKNGFFTPQQIDSSAASLSALSPSQPVQSMINYLQCLQQTDLFRYDHANEFIQQTIFRMIRTAEQIPNGASPFMICFNSGKESRHAVIGYGCEEGSWKYMDRQWPARILVYDPNHGKFSDADCVYYDPVQFRICIPAYSFFWDSSVRTYQVFFKVCGDTEILNTPPYPFAERFGGAGIPGDADGSGTVGAEDVTMLLDYLLCKTELSADAAARADLSGDGILTAADLSLLKQRLL